MTFNFQVQGEIQEIVKTGLWVGDCFIYTSSVNRLNYYVGGEIVTIAHLDRYNYRWFSMMYLNIVSILHLKSKTEAELSLLSFLHLL